MPERKLAGSATTDEYPHYPIDKTKRYGDRDFPQTIAIALDARVDARTVQTVEQQSVPNLALAFRSLKMHISKCKH